MSIAGLAKQQLSKITSNPTLAGYATKYLSLPEHQRMVVGGSIAGSLAIGTNMINGRDDTLLETAQDVAVAGGAVIGAEAIAGRALAGKADNLTVSDVVKQQLKKHAGKPAFSRANSVGLVTGALVGLGSGDRDGLGNVVDAGIGAVAGYGAGTLYESLVNETGFEGLGKRKVSMTDVAKIQTEIEAEESFVKRGMRFGKGAKIVTALGAMAIGAGAIVDARNEMAQNKRVERQMAEQEKQLRRRETREDRAMADMFGYAHVDMGEIVMEMFNERIGHHKMGNAKFQ